MKAFNPVHTGHAASPMLTARRAYEELRHQILTGHLAQGDVVNEVEMARCLSVSRTPLREAFRELLNDGLLVGDGPRRQVRVVTVDGDLLREVFVSRSALEPIIAAAAARVGADDLVDLRLVAARMKDTVIDDDFERFLTLDDEFHAALARAAGNTLAEEHLRKLRAMTCLRLSARGIPASTLRRLGRNRSDLVSALASADEERARRRATEYVDLYWRLTTA